MAQIRLRQTNLPRKKRETTREALHSLFEDDVPVYIDIAVTSADKMTVRPTWMALGSRGKKKSISRKNFVPMVALLLITVLCITDAIRPSVTPGVGKKTTPRRPLRRLWYRRLEKGAEDVTRSRRIPLLDRVRPGQEAKQQDDLSLYPEGIMGSISREALAEELSTLLQDIETSTLEIDSTSSFPAIEALAKQKPESLDASSKKGSRVNIKNVHDLRQAVLDEGKALKECELDKDAQLLVNATAHEMLNHDVVQLMAKRFRTGSTPGNRAPDDKARLALAIEGGGECRPLIGVGDSSALYSCTHPNELFAIP